MVVYFKNLKRLSEISFHEAECFVRS